MGMDSIANAPDNHDPDSALAGILFGDGDMCTAAEDAVHELREHRVTHLHSERYDSSPLQHIRGKLLHALYATDGCGWRLLPSRSVYVRSFEHHSYEVGGSVMDPEHIDDGSILTLSVLLNRSDDCEGGIFRTYARDGSWQSYESVAPGDAVIFLSHTRHNVTPLTAGRRQSMVMELSEGGVTRHN